MDSKTAAARRSWFLLKSLYDTGGLTSTFQHAYNKYRAQHAEFLTKDGKLGKNPPGSIVGRVVGEVVTEEGSAMTFDDVTAHFNTDKFIEQTPNPNEKATQTQSALL